MFVSRERGMDLKASLGFGFFSKAKSKTRKHSERQLADMYNKVAIRGSIQHVWGDELPRDEHSRSRPHSRQKHRKREEKTRSSLVTSRSGSKEVETRHRETAPHISTSDRQMLAALAPAATVVVDMGNTSPIELAPPLQPLEPVQAAFSLTAENFAERLRSPSIETDLSLERVLAGPFPPRPRSISSSRRPSSNDDTTGYHTVQKKFSFCPSTISLVSPLAPGTSPRNPRTVATPGNAPYASSIKSSVFSSSTPSIPRRVSSLTNPSQQRHYSDDLVSMADDEDEHDGFHSISSSNSVHYSIVSHISSIHDTKDEQYSFLPGQIYAPALPDALRRCNASAAYYENMEDEDDEDESVSISGLSEVNAAASDSDFSDMNLDQEVGLPSTQLSTAVNPGLRRDSVKRVSYTRLDSGEYLAVVQHRSKTHIRDNSSSSGSFDAPARPLERAASSASAWSVDHEFISGGI